MISHAILFRPSSRGLDPREAGAAEREALPDEELQDGAGHGHVDQEVEAAQSVAGSLLSAQPAQRRLHGARLVARLEDVMTCECTHTQGYDR